MSVFYDYFVAPDRGTAAAVLDHGPFEAGLETIEQCGFDPVVALGILVAELTDRPADDVIDTFSSEDLVASRDGAGTQVYGVPPFAVDALADASDAARREAVGRWATSEDMVHFEEDVLHERASELAELARAARTASSGLYCWVCL